MRCSDTAAEPYAAKVRSSALCLAQPQTALPLELDAVVVEPCVAGANFCQCWMPAWFRLAELVAQERGSSHESWSIRQ